MHKTSQFFAAALIALISSRVHAQSVLKWSPTTNAVPCSVCVTAPADPGGEFLACRLVDQDTEEGRLGYCVHVGDEGHYTGTPGEIDGIEAPPVGSYSTTIVIHPVPNVNFDCVGWQDRPADGSPGAEGVFECYPRSVPDPSIATATARHHHRHQ